MLDFSKLALVSSNLNKLKEYSNYGLQMPLLSGRDILEISGTDEEVIIYKALAAGENAVIEDTSLSVEGMDVGVNVKWLIHELHTNPQYHGRKATWKVLLGVLQNQKIYIIEGIIHGTIDNSSYSSQAFGFDSVFKPAGSNNTLDELQSMNMKHLFSARKIAVDNILNQRFIKVIDSATVPVWTGKYQ